MRAEAPFSNNSGSGRSAGSSNPSQRATERGSLVWRAQRSLEGLLSADQVCCLVISKGALAAKASRTSLSLGCCSKEEIPLRVEELFDEVGGGLFAFVGEDGESAGDFEGGGLKVAAGEFVSFGEGAVDAKTLGEAGNFASGQLTRGLNRLAGNGESATLGGIGVEKGLEARAELATGVEGAVELGRLGVAGGDDGADGSGGGLDGNEAALESGEGGDEFVDAVAGEFLQFAVDARSGGEPTGGKIVLVEEFVEVTASTADGVGLHFARGQEVERFCERLVAFFKADFAISSHFAKDVVALAEGRFEIVAGREVVGSTDDADEEGAFGDGELGGFFPKIGLGGLLDSIGASSEVNAVEVGGDDFVFGIIGLDSEGEGCFEKFAMEGKVANLVGIARELHRDGGRSLGDAAVLEVAEGGSQHATKVDAAVFVKFFVFASGEGVDERLGNLFASNDPAAGAMDSGEFLAVAVEEEGALGHLFDFLNVKAGSGDPITDADENEKEDGDEGESEKNTREGVDPGRDLFAEFWFVFFLPSHALGVLLRDLPHFCEKKNQDCSKKMGWSRR